MIHLPWHDTAFVHGRWFMVLLLLLSGHELNTIVRFPEHHSKAQTFLDISPHHTIPYPSVHSRVSAKSPSCATIVLTRMIADYITHTLHPSFQYVLPLRWPESQKANSCPTHGDGKTSGLGTATTLPSSRLGGKCESRRRRRRSIQMWTHGTSRTIVLDYEG